MDDYTELLARLDSRTDPAIVFPDELAGEAAAAIRALIAERDAAGKDMSDREATLWVTTKTQCI